MKFCKKNKIKVYIKDDIKVAKNVNANGVFLSSNNKRKCIINNNFNQKINFKLIGAAHSQNDFFLKKSQSLYSQYFPNEKKKK